MKPMSKGFFLFVVIIGIIITSSCWLLAEETGEGPLYPRDALVILSTTTIPQMQSARSFLEEKGVRVKSIFPPCAFIVNLPSETVSDLKDSSFIKEISFTPVDITLYPDAASSLQDAIRVWNKLLTPPPATESFLEKELQHKLAQEVEVSIPQDLPKTEEEKLLADKKYQAHWQASQKKVSLASPPKGTAPMSFGKASGAGFYDTSLYLAGDVVVGIFFTPVASWPPYQGENVSVDNAFQAVSAGINFHFVDNKSDPFYAPFPLLNNAPQGARLRFSFIKEVDAQGVPKVPPTDTEARRTYLNDLRNTYNTHWAFMIIIQSGSNWPKGDYLGPAITLGDFVWGSFYSQNLVMPILQVFGALPQWKMLNQSPTSSSGYLNVVNANSDYNDGTGFFGGAGEGNEEDYMSDVSFTRSQITTFTRGQIGWRDSDGDGIIDPLDTYAYANQLFRIADNPVIYNGRAIDKPLLNAMNDDVHGDVTLNTISKVEYRLNNGAWCLAIANDGKFDSAEEEYSFTLPPLKNGKYLVEVRATNSAGNTQAITTKDELLVENSAVTNAPPFASFSITPLTGSTSTNFIFDASESSDIEDLASSLQVRWDFNNDGIWDTGYSTTKTNSFRYSSAGAKTIKLELKDSNGLTQTLTKQLQVASANTPPVAVFTVTPENQHGLVDPFEVTLDASGSYDSEDAPSNLQVRWDFDNDRIWDTDYSSNLMFEHSFDLPKTLPVVGKWQSKDGTTENVFIVGNYAYVADGSVGLQILDITNRQNPTLIKTFLPQNSNYVGYVFVSGNYAYLSCWRRGLKIVDISNPTAPRELSSYSTSYAEYAVVVSGKYAYAASGTGGLRIYDVSRPSMPILVGVWKNSSPVTGIELKGNYAYLSNEMSGFQIIDVSRPTSPVLVGGCDTDFARGGGICLGELRLSC